MNLKSKLTAKVTHVVKIISATQAIMSDECSPSHVNALTIVEAANKQELWDKIRSVSQSQASLTRFPCVVALINEADELTYRAPVKPVTKPIDINEYI